MKLLIIIIIIEMGTNAKEEMLEAIRFRLFF